MKSIRITSIFTWALRLLQVVFLVLYEMVFLEFRFFGFVGELFVPYGVLFFAGLASILAGCVVSWSKRNNGGGWLMIIGSIAWALAFAGSGIEWWILWMLFVSVPFMIIGILVMIDSWIERHDPPQYDGVEGGWGGTDARPSHIFHDNFK
jgi:hypothetical protein